MLHIGVIRCDPHTLDLQPFLIAFFFFELFASSLILSMNNILVSLAFTQSTRLRTRHLFLMSSVHYNLLVRGKSIFNQLQFVDGKHVLKYIIAHLIIITVTFTSAKDQRASKKTQTRPRKSNLNRQTDNRQRSFIIVRDVNLIHFITTQSRKTNTF